MKSFILAMVVAALLPSLHAAAQPVTDDDLQLAWQHCKSKKQPFPKVDPFPWQNPISYQPGFEGCAVIYERFGREFEAAKARREQEEKDAAIKALVDRVRRGGE